MKVLLDECLRRKLKYALASHDCKTVPEAGLAGTKNGVLLSLAEDGGFEVFLTMDKGLPYQQNLEGPRIAIVIIRAESNRLHDLLPQIEQCLAVMRSIQPGEVARIGGYQDGGPITPA